ncbi:MAG: MspA family porin, partial [Mycobacterium sp.]|nr:MspA family porin [Mycobacterium sp.]
SYVLLFRGSIELGYQVGFANTVDGAIGFLYDAPPQLLFYGVDEDLDDDASYYPLNIADSTVLPEFDFTVAVGEGPGVQLMAVSRRDVTAPAGKIRIGGAYGSVSSVVGPVTIRPYLTLTSSGGGQATVYGDTATL